MGESLCHFSLCICSGKVFVWKMASSLFQNTSKGLLDVGYTTEVLVIFFPGWPFHLGQALKESALSSQCCPVLSTGAASSLFAEMSLVPGAARGTQRAQNKYLPSGYRK